MNKNKIFIITAALLLLVSGIFYFSKEALAACVDPVTGEIITLGPVKVPPTVSINDIDVSYVDNGNSISIAVSGDGNARYYFNPCSLVVTQVKDVAIYGSVSQNGNLKFIFSSQPIYPTVGGGGGYSYSLSKTILASSLLPGTYQLKVEAYSPSNSSSPVVDVKDLVVPPPPPSPPPPPEGGGSGGTAVFTPDYVTDGQSYSFSVVNAPANSSGTLNKWKKDSNGNWVKIETTPGWITTNNSGSATKGPWPCNSSGNGETKATISWPNGTETNEAYLTCYAPPPPPPPPPVNASATINPSTLVIGGGNVTLSWSGCGAILNAGIGLNLGSGSGSLSLPAVFNSETGDPVSYILSVQGCNGGSNASATFTPFFSYLHWYAFKKNSCEAADNTAERETTLEGENGVRFTAKRVYSDNGNVTTWPDSYLNDGNDQVWSYNNNHQATYSVDSVTLVPSGYKYCSNSGPVTFSDPTVPKEDTIKLYFAPSVGGGQQYTLSVSKSGTGSGTVISNPSGINCGADCTESYNSGTQVTLIANPDSGSSFIGWSGDCSGVGDCILTINNNKSITATFNTSSITDPPKSAPDLSGVAECHMNYPTSSVQSYLSWTEVPDATSYEVWWDKLINQLLITTSNLFYIHRDLNSGSSYSYFVNGKNSVGSGPDSNTVTLTMPSSCSNPPPPPPGATPTLVITPSSQTISVGDNASYIALYDPDGTQDRYGDFDVTQLANWSSDNSTIASLQGKGLFRGEKSGSTLVHATYQGLTANASISVLAENDFSLSITPNLREVQKPGQAQYTVTVSKIGNFSGNVTLSAPKLPVGVTASFSPQVVLGGSGTSTLTLNVSNDALIGRSTFDVKGVSGNLSHLAQADINITGTPPQLSCEVVPDPQSGPAPLTTSVSVSGSGGTPPYSYRYDWTSDGTFDTPYGSSPRNHTYTNPGTYRITAEVKDATGAVKSCDTSALSSSCTGSNCDVCVGDNCGGNQPSVDLKVNGSDGPLTLAYLPGSNFGATMDINWQASNVSSCTASASPDVTGWSGVLPSLSGQVSAYAFDVNPDPNQGTNYQLQITCNPTDSVSVNVIECGPGSESVPQCQQLDACYLTATPSTIIPGQFTTLEWGCTNPQGKICTIDQGIGEVDPQGGTKRVNPRQTTTYTLSCTGVDPSSATVRVSFLKKIREIIPW
ncbi:MAG: PKD domain-containing protein [Patescibacteria group bacterium]|nr:PKD domain-containing protein [Patescibacteria group bacterium]